ncbi:MAG TPA: histidine kinase [Bryobacteraceae bacterium]|nr:histidine kinase [Bryobacteraceae bacterium]
MNLMDTISPVVLILGAVLAASLFLAILRRAKRDAEVWTLLGICAGLSLQLGFWGFGDWLFYSLQVIGPRTHYILTAAALFTSALLIGLFTQFLGLTYLRVSSDRADAPPVFLALRERTLNFLCFAVPYYALSVAGMTLIVIRLSHSLDDPSAWNSRSLLTSGFSSSFVMGLFTGFWPALQAIVLREVERRLPEDKKKELPRFFHWFAFYDVDRVQHWKELSILPEVQKAEPSTSEDYTAELKAFVVLLVWYIPAVMLFGLSESSRLQNPLFHDIWQFGLRLILAFAMLPLVYYKTQFLFFDVLMKRGVVICALFATSLVYFTALFRLQHLTGVQSGVIWGGVVGFVGLWMLLYRGLERAMDRYIFRRPDYGGLLRNIGSEATRFVETGPLIEYVTAKLRDALAADFVRFRKAGEAAGEPAAVTAVPLGRGQLEFGKRNRNQPYRSEDLEFIKAVAGIAGAMFDNIERQRELKDRQQNEVQLRELAARSELKALRAQINPHFLFNALNTLADLTRHDAKVAEELVVALAEMFRFALDASHREEVRLGDEIAFVRSYLEIERARFGAKLRYTIDVPGELEDYLIPPMLIQPLIENSVKHGIAPRPLGGSLTVRARLYDGMINVVVEDDGKGFEPGGVRNGIGLANVRERIEKLSGPHHFTLRTAPREGTSVSFDITAKAQSTESDYASPHR